MTKSERSAAPTPRSSIMKPLYVSAFGLLKMTHSAAIASLWIILMSAEGLSNTEQGRRLEVDRQRVRRWRVRWAANEERLAGAESEGVSDEDLASLLATLLEDRGGRGMKPRFTAEQLTQIIAVACELPEDCGRPVTHWTPCELADEVILRDIVVSISPRRVDRILKGGHCARTRAGTG